MKSTDQQGDGALGVLMIVTFHHEKNYAANRAHRY